MHTPFQAFEFEPRRGPRAAMRVCPQRRDCGNVSQDISLKLKEEASEGGRAGARRFKGPEQPFRARQKNLADQ